MLTYCCVCHFVLEQQCTVSWKLLFCGKLYVNLSGNSMRICRTYENVEWKRSSVLSRGKCRLYSGDVQNSLSRATRYDRFLGANRFVGCGIFSWECHIYFEENEKMIAIKSPWRPPSFSCSSPLIPPRPAEPSCTTLVVRWAIFSYPPNLCHFVHTLATVNSQPPWLARRTNYSTICPSIIHVLVQLCHSWFMSREVGIFKQEVCK